MGEEVELPAAEAPNEAAGAPEGSAQGVKCVNVAGWRCSTREELMEKVRAIQEAANQAEDGRLSAQDSFFMFHLLLRHPKAAEIMTRPLSLIRYGTYDKFKNKCFILVQKDGSQEGISASKSVDVLIPKKGARPGAAPVCNVAPPAAAPSATEAATATAKAKQSPTAAPEEPRGSKRPREEAVEDAIFKITRNEGGGAGFFFDAATGRVSSVEEGGAAARAGMGPGQKGWIITHVDGKEVDNATRLSALSATKAAGRTFELRIRRPEGEPTTKRKGAVFEPLPVVRGCLLDVVGFRGKPDYDRLKEQLSGYGLVRSLQLIKLALKGDDASGEAVAAVEMDTNSATIADDAEGSAAEAEVEEGNKATEAHSASASAKAKPRQTIARCRFDGPAAAEKAAAGLTEVAGEPVTCRLLSVAEEGEHWEALNAKLRDNFEGRGRKGKGRARSARGRGKARRES